MSVHGVGINDSNYPVTRKLNGKRVWICPFYHIWVNMIRRCYDSSFHKQNTTYLNCVVCEEWLTFSNFRKWMETQDWEDKCLDKDILYPNNKVYSPETCVFVSKEVNNFILEGLSKRGMYSIGVSWDSNKKKFVAQCSRLDPKVSKFLGYFSDEESAHKAWLKEKQKLSKILASYQSDERVAKALIDKYENYKGGQIDYSCD